MRVQWTPLRLSHEKLLQSLVVYLHCSPRARVTNANLRTYFICVDGGMVSVRTASLCSLVFDESPDSATLITPTVNPPKIRYKKDCINITFVAYSFISVIVWWLVRKVMRKFNHSDKRDSRLKAGGKSTIPNTWSTYLSPVGSKSSGYHLPNFSGAYQKSSQSCGVASVIIDLQFFEFKVITAGIIILQINHLSISEAGEFAEQKVNKLMIFFSEHYQHIIGVYSVPAY